MAARMSAISTHVLDIARGLPAGDVPVRLERQESSGDWRPLGSARTDRDGRCGELLSAGESVRAGHYRMTFDTASYFATQKIKGLYPTVLITFAVRAGE